MKLTPTNDPEAIARLTSSERLQQLRDLIMASVEAVRTAAAIFAVMEAEGDDVSSLPHHLRAILRSVHAQTLLPEVVAQLTGRLRQRVQYLSIEEQRRIIAGGTVPFLPSADGEAQELDPQSLNPQQIKQVFDERHIRTIEEQREYLRNQRPPRREKASTASDDGYIIDRQKKVVVIGSRAFTEQEIRIMLADLTIPRR